MATVDSLLIENNQCVGVVVQGEAIKSTHVVSSIGALPSYQFLLPHSKYNTVAQNVIKSYNCDTSWYLCWWDRS